MTDSINGTFQKRRKHRRTEVSSIDAPISEVREGGLGCSASLNVVCLGVPLNREAVRSVLVVRGTVHNLGSFNDIERSQSEGYSVEKVAESHNLESP
jgi:hypothetical protein